MPETQITTERLTLRLATDADIPAIIRYFEENRAFLEPWEPGKPHDFYTPAFWATQVQRNHEQARALTSMRLCIFPHDAPGEMIGTANFTDVVRGAFHACYLGYSLSAEREGHGLMREALRTAIPHVFAELKLHRIMANYLPHNRRSAAVLKSLGFTVEGYARDYLHINGKWEDHVLTSLTNHDWVEEKR